MRKSLLIGIVLIICFVFEYVSSWQFLQGVVPFPENECWLLTLNGFLRDACILGALVLLNFRRNRISDRARRYFPVVVVGVLYLLMGAFIISYLELDVQFLTTLSLFAGLFNNIAVVLVVAMC